MSKKHDACPRMAKDAGGIRIERVDTKNGIVETVTIPEASLWAPPMSLRAIGKRVNRDWRTVRGWIQDKKFEARPCGELWQVPASLFGWSGIIEAIEEYNAHHQATFGDNPTQQS